MKSSVEVYVIPAGEGLAAVPRPGGRREVEAQTTDGLRAAATDALQTEGYRVRALSFCPDGLVAYVEAGA